MRVNLEVQGAAIFDVAGGLLAAHGDLRCLNQLPLATLVVSDVGLHVLLSLIGWDRLLDLIDLVFRLVLLSVHVTTVAHARVARVTGFLCNHVSFIPLLVFILALFSPVIDVTKVALVPVLLVQPCDHVGAVLVRNESSIE